MQTLLSKFEQAIGSINPSCLNRGLKAIRVGKRSSRECGICELPQNNLRAFFAFINFNTNHFPVDRPDNSGT